jgi:hypothetical protein|tara:strand:- start:3694 stop:3999 length:306 start_codon:yes stop_codon:yes gene_type:complete
MVGKINVNVDKIVNHKHKTEREHMNDEALSQLRALRSKMSSVLIQTNVVSSDTARKLSVELESMKADERFAFIESRWGKLYAEKVQPLLHQIKTLEDSIFG